jgi:hypothetical protein
METLTKYVDFQCAQHIVNDTLESGYYEQFKGQTSESVYESYIKTYGPSEHGRGMLNQRGLSSFTDIGDIHLLRRFSEYVAMVYCNDAKTVQNMAKLNLRVGDFVVDQWDDDHRGVLKFFIATNTQQNITAVVLRGTDSLVDVLLDFRIQPIPINLTALPIPSFPGGVTEGHVHQGFWERYQHERRDIARKLRKVIKKYNGQTDIVVVGHSLGAAWGFLETADLILREKIDVKALYAYGMPAVGDAPFVDALATAQKR